jgi:Leu/Phe-tRNA-protein transferase
VYAGDLEHAICLAFPNPCRLLHLQALLDKQLLQHRHQQQRQQVVVQEQHRRLWQGVCQSRVHQQGQWLSNHLWRTLYQESCSSTLSVWSRS